MVVDIKYKGLGDESILVTPQGRFAAPQMPTADGPDLMSPMGLYMDSRDSEVRLKLRQAEQDQAVRQIEARINSLARKIEHLPIPESDLVSRVKTALSPKPDAFSAVAAEDATAPATHTMEVQWTSRGAQMLSNFANPVAEVTAADGDHTFTLTIDDDEYEIMVEVDNGGSPDAWETFLGLSEGATDTNEELLKRMAIAISGIDERVGAEVEYVERDAYDPTPRTRPMNRMARLKVYSTVEGTGPDIRLSDEDGTLITGYGLDKQLPPRTASVRTEGVLHALDDDTVHLDNGQVTGTALSNTVGPMDLTVAAGGKPITEALIEVVADYNNLVGYINSKSDLLRPSLLDRITRPTEQLAGDLASLGFEPTASGRLGMSLDLATRVTSDFGRVREVMFSEDGWVSMLSSKLGQIQTSGVDAFTVELGVPPALSQHQQVRAMMDNITANIINGYVW